MIDYRAPLDELPDPLPIEPLTRPFDVTITPPGSKSITCRAYVLAALAEGESEIIRPLRAEDTDNLLDALCVLGAQARWDGDDVYITGVAGRFPRGGEVNLGDGGTPTRFMIACACLAAEPVVVDGSARMRERPIAEGVDMLRQLGAKIEYVEEEGRLPVRVSPSDEFKGGELTIGKTASSQFISALMLIGPWLGDGLKLKATEELTSRSYVQLTTSVQRDWKIHARPFSSYSGSPRGYRIQTQRVTSASYSVAPDASSAAYWYLATAIVPKARVDIPELSGSFAGIVQPDREALIYITGFYVGNKGATSFRYRRQHVPSIMEAESCPDGALALAILASCAESRSTITGLHTLRVKETDRIAALANELRKVGCDVETTDDSITITPMKNPPAEPGAKGNEVVIETYNDHRMAMAFAVLGLVRPGISIRNPTCVAKSYPGFWRDFAKLYEE